MFMSAEDDVRNAVGGLISGTGPRYAIVQSFPVEGPSNSDEKIAALERDIRGIYEALLVLARQLDELRSKLVGG
jgi:hypothetical protein